jgi:hypothetical protein
MFLAILFVVIALVNAAYIRFIQPQKIVERRLASYEDLVINLEDPVIDYIFFGDSHIEGAINPLYIDGTSFNFAIGGQSYTETYYLFKRLIENNDVKFNNVVLQLDPHTFSGSVRGGKFLFDQIYFYSKFVDARKMAELKGESLASVFLRTEFPFLGNGKHFIDSILKLDDLTLMYLGWQNSHETTYYTDNRQEIAAETFQHYFSEGSSMIDKVTFDYFLETLKLAKESNINVIFLKYPISEEYYSEIDKNIDLDDYYRSIFAEADKILDDYAVIDLHDYFFEKGEYYWDPEHLTSPGAEIFSKKMNEELKRK